MFSSSLIKGTLQTIILKLLYENKRMYGYEITKQVEESSQGSIKLTFGAIYPTLHKLEKGGLLTSENVEVDNRLRKYYSLTSKGREAAVRKIKEYESFARVMDVIILSNN